MRNLQCNIANLKMEKIMIYKIENKKMKITLKNEIMELPIKLKEEINKNFENMKKRRPNGIPSSPVISSSREPRHANACCGSYFLQFFLSR